MDVNVLGELFGLHGRVAVVVGGGGRIGSSAARLLRALGARVALVDVELPSAGDDRDVSHHLFDIERGDVAALARDVREAHGRVDVLLHAAALVGTSPLPGWAVGFEEQSVETWRRALEVNLTSAFRITQALSEPLQRHGTGSVIYVSSIYGHVGPDARLYEGLTMANPAAYAASKGGLQQLTRWLATTLAPRVRVNSISPGGILRGQPEAFLERYAARVPLQRLGQEQDLLGAVALLASDAGSYITGQDVLVDGGYTAW